MKQRSGIVFLLFGLVMAGLVGAAVFRMAKQAQATQVETVDMLVVTRDVPERTILTPAMVTIRKTVPEARPTGVLTNPSQVEGRMTLTRLYAGDPVIPSKLADTNGHSGLTYTLEPGKVAITFPASDILTTGALRVGDHVDLLITVNVDEKEAGASANQAQQSGGNEGPLPPTTQTAMQNLRILGIGSVAGPLKEGMSIDRPEKVNLITFAVSHQDALILKALKDSKSVRFDLVLRAAGDDQIVETEPVTIQTIIEKYKLRPNEQ